jgi:hypothetical protein
MNGLMRYTFFSQVLAFTSLLFCLVALMVTLNSLWRTHKMLATFIRLCVFTIVIFALRKILGVLGYNQETWWVAITQYFDIFQSLFFMLAALELYRIIRVLDGETMRSGGLRPSALESKHKK